MKWCQESDGYLLKLHVEKFTEFKKVCLLVETNRLPAEKLLTIFPVSINQVAFITITTSY